MCIRDSAYTSRDGNLWEKESKNFYYEYGPLAREEIGAKQVQGKDYAYTAQGWLKTINSSMGVKKNDAGADGVNGNINENFGKDAYGFSLHYFKGDYQAIGNQANAGLIANINNTTYDQNSPDLFNGNISKMIVGLSNEQEQAITVFGNAYRYDALNRLKAYKPFQDKQNNSPLSLIHI